MRFFVTLTVQSFRVSHGYIESTYLLQLNGWLIGLVKDRGLNCRHSLNVLQSWSQIKGIKVTTGLFVHTYQPNNRG